MVKVAVTNSDLHSKVKAKFLTFTWTPIVQYSRLMRLDLSCSFSGTAINSHLCIYISFHVKILICLWMRICFLFPVQNLQTKSLSLPFLDRSLYPYIRASDFTGRWTRNVYVVFLNKGFLILIFAACKLLYNVCDLKI